MIDPMDPAPDAALLRAVRGYAQFVAVGTALTGLVVLVGWAFDVQWLKTMKANTALAFVLAGFSLWLLHPGRMQPWQELLGRACSVVPLLVGGLTLAEYFGNWDLGIDQLLFRGDVSTVAAAAPGRPSPIAAVELVIFAMGLLSLRTGPAGDCRTSQVHAAIAVAFGVLGFLGHLYGATLVRVNPAYTSMALHTSITFQAPGQAPREGNECGRPGPAGADQQRVGAHGSPDRRSAGAVEGDPAPDAERGA